MSTRIENEKGTILEAIKMAFDEFDDYEDIRSQAAEVESDFSLSISVKILDGEQKVTVKLTGSIKKTAEANAYFDEGGQLKLDFDTEPMARAIERAMGMNNCVLGLDLSLTSTGWAIEAGDGRRKWGVIKTSERGAARLDYIDVVIARIVEEEMPDLVVIENYAYGKSQSMAPIAELGGVVRLLLHRMERRFIAVAPTSLKKFVTGSGRAEKGSVMMHCLQNWKVIINNNNEADAFGLCQFGRCYLNAGEFKEFQRQTVEQFKRKEAANDQD